MGGVLIFIIYAPFCMNGLVIERVGGSQFYYTRTILHEWVGYIVKVGGFSFSLFTHHFAGVGYSKSSD